MSRLEESKLFEHEGRLDEISHELKSLKEEERPERKMTMFRVVAIEFKEDHYKVGEAQVNRNLSVGMEVTKDFQTDSGVVIVMTKWVDKKETRKDAHLCAYCSTKEEVIRND